jgi:hypothetical protein
MHPRQNEGVVGTLILESPGDKLWHRGSDFTTADASRVFGVRHQDAGCWGRPAGAISVAHVAVERGEDAD